MFKAIVHGLGQLLAFFYDLVPNYGVAIIMLTVTVRVAMIPLAVKQAHLMVGQRANAEKMRKIQPELKRLKEKHKDDRAKFYEEQKKLMEHHGVSMLGSLSGCLPMLLQMPIFMAMYQVLSGCNKILGAGRKCSPEYFVPAASALFVAIKQAEATFLSMNLNFKPSEVLKSGGVADAWPYYLLSVFMGVTMWYQTKQMTAAQPAPDPQMASTQKIMQLFPLLLVFASVNFPLGLTLYWSATNVWAIGQQYFLLKRYGPQAAHAQAMLLSKKGLTEPTASSNGNRSSKTVIEQTATTANGKVQPKQAGKPKGSGAKRGKKKRSGRR